MNGKTSAQAVANHPEYGGLAHASHIPAPHAAQTCAPGIDSHRAAWDGRRHTQTTSRHPSQLLMCADPGPFHCASTLTPKMATAGTRRP